LEGPIAADEVLARFILDRSQLRADRSVKHNAFMPPPSAKLSVYRIVGLCDPEVWQLGNEYVANIRGKPLVGRAEIKALEVTNCDLSVEATTVPHPRHANIKGWKGDTEKDRLTAIKLASKAGTAKLT